jgi:PAS domain-containing protein
MGRNTRASAAKVVGLDGDEFNLGPDVDFRDFFENGLVALHIVGADGTIRYANKAELQLLGYAYDDYVGQPIRDFHVDADVIEASWPASDGGKALRGCPLALGRVTGRSRTSRSRPVPTWSMGNSSTADASRST